MFSILQGEGHLRRLVVLVLLLRLNIMRQQRCHEPGAGSNYPDMACQRVAPRTRAHVFIIPVLHTRIRVILSLRPRVIVRFVSRPPFFQSRLECTVGHRSPDPCFFVFCI